MISNFSKFHFSRVFFEVTGETIFQFISRLRLQKAASSLIRSNASISEIAYKNVYNSLSVFSKKSNYVLMNQQLLIGRGTK